MSKKALDLLGVQIHGQDPVCPGSHQQVGDELGRNRHARLVFAILPWRNRKKASLPLIRLALARRTASIMMNNSIK